MSIENQDASSDAQPEAQAPVGAPQNVKPAKAKRTSKVQTQKAARIAPEPRDSTKSKVSRQGTSTMPKKSRPSSTKAADSKTASTPSHVVSATAKATVAITKSVSRIHPDYLVDNLLDPIRYVGDGVNWLRRRRHIVLPSLNQRSSPLYLTAIGIWDTFSDIPEMWSEKGGSWVNFTDDLTTPAADLILVDSSIVKSELERIVLTYLWLHGPMVPLLVCDPSSEFLRNFPHSSVRALPRSRDEASDLLLEAIRGPAPIVALKPYFQEALNRLPESFFPQEFAEQLRISQPILFAKAIGSVGNLSVPRWSLCIKLMELLIEDDRLFPTLEFADGIPPSYPSHKVMNQQIIRRKSAR